MDWNNVRFRSSAIGYLLTEPQSQVDKDAGNLSKTAKKYLLEVYIAEKYNRKKDIQTKQMKKGIEVEGDSIDLLSLYFKKPFSKNEERFNNDFITGMPDVIDGNHIIDIKSSYDLWTFLGNIPDKLDSLYYAQLQSYMWLTGAIKGTIAYCLSNTPFSIIEQEKKSLLYKMDVISDDSPEYKKEANKLEFCLKFDDIKLEEKILLFHVDRDEDFISKIQYKVEKSREFLLEIENKHINFNK